jgi:hypothetical protein
MKSALVPPIPKVKGYIYKIASPNTELYYIGSTTNIKNRFSTHVSIYKKYSDNASKINSMSYKILKFGDAYIEIIDEIEFNDRSELYDLEKKHIMQGGDNVVNKSYNVESKYYNREKQREYYLKNRNARCKYQQEYRKRIKEMIAIKI